MQRRRADGQERGEKQQVKYGQRGVQPVLAQRVQQVAEEHRAGGRPDQPERRLADPVREDQLCDDHQQEYVHHREQRRGQLDRRRYRGGVQPGRDQERP